MRQAGSQPTRKLQVMIAAVSSVRFFRLKLRALVAGAILVCGLLPPIRTIGIVIVPDDDFGVEASEKDDFFSEPSRRSLLSFSRKIPTGQCTLIMFVINGKNEKMFFSVS